MGISLVRVYADGRPDVVVPLGGAEDIAPFVLPSGDVEEAGNPPRPGIGEDLLLPLGKPGVIEVTVAVDQPHFAATSSSSGSSRRGKSGCG